MLKMGLSAPCTLSKWPYQAFFMQRSFSISLENGHYVCDALIMLQGIVFFLLNLFSLIISVIIHKLFSCTLLISLFGTYTAWYYKLWFHKTAVAYLIFFVQWLLYFNICLVISFATSWPYLSLFVSNLSIFLGFKSDMYFRDIQVFFYIFGICIFLKS